MTQQNLGKALLDLGAAGLSGVPDVRHQTWAILDRDRRRVRRLAGLTLCAWGLSTLLIFLVLYVFGLTFPRAAQLRMDVERGKITQAQREAVQGDIDLAMMKGNLLIAFSVVALSIAALSTVLLNLASRRATLRQINASLLEISEQLKALRGATSATG